ncbi:MAG: ferrochelatase [Sulfuricurvum sp.]|uniref:ferrochelatase n=1 Tax=Sulfuricurvum sp. TaxID=2025608 RepID=UPI002609B596|nr:ferrochelatase [Sulfuricurvum sp.]MDD5118099.1 ferrochelatase [Sulfuricurvum sp.]
MREAIVLLNMGGPNNLNEVEMFLHNMFNDPYIIRTKSTLLRKLIAGMITLTRTEKSQDIYRQIGGKSPIVDITRSLVERLNVSVGEEVIVDFIMRYTPPMAREVCTRLQESGVEKVYLIPLYPQYSSTTTQSSLDDFEQTAHEIGWNVITTEIKHFFSNETYNRCVVERIKESLGSDSAGSFDIVFSAHGLPQNIVDQGDPYQRQVIAHVGLIEEMLKKNWLDFNGIHLAYQSKVGPMKWLEPSLETTLRSLSNKKVIIVPIAFTIDNSETDFELSIEYAEVAHELGYQEYRVCRCANDHPLFVQTLIELYEKMK